MEDDFQDFLDVDSQSIVDSTYNPPTIPQRMQNKMYQRGNTATAEYRFNNINNADQDELDFNIRSSKYQGRNNKVNLKRSIVDQNDQIQILGISSSQSNNKINAIARQSGQNISNFSTDSEIRGAQKIALKKQTVNKFLKRVEKTKKRFVQYQTAKKEAKLKNRLGIPQSEREKRQLEEFKLQNSQYYNQSELNQDQDEEEEEEQDEQQYDDDQDDIQSEYLDECKSIHSHGWSQRSHFTIKSAPTPYLAQTSGGPVVRSYNQHQYQNKTKHRNHKNMQRKKIGVKPKDFKKKDDFVFFDLFTLYAQNYMGKNKKKQQQQQQMMQINQRGEEIIEQDDLQLQSQIIE